MKSWIFTEEISVSVRVSERAAVQHRGYLYLLSSGQHSAYIRPYVWGAPFTLAPMCITVHKGTHCPARLCFTAVIFLTIITSASLWLMGGSRKRMKTEDLENEAKVEKQKPWEQRRLENEEIWTIHDKIVSLKRNVRDGEIKCFEIWLCHHKAKCCRQSKQLKSETDGPKHKQPKQLLGSPLATRGLWKGGMHYFIIITINTFSSHIEPWRIS